MTPEPSPAGPAAGLREALRALPRSRVEALLSGLAPAELQALAFDWPTWARAEQLPDDDDPAWHVFLYLAGRGAGKSRSGAEWIRKQAREHPGCRIALVGRTSADCSGTMIQGEAGLIACSPPDERPVYIQTARKLLWPNGSMATTYAAEASEGDQLRGPSHHFAWADELCSWPNLDMVWANLLLGLRLGDRPRVFVSTTPRPSKLLRSLLASPTTVVRRSSTYANAANLPAAALREFRAKYESTRIGRQELHAEVLDEVEGALWNQQVIDASRVAAAPPLTRVVVAVDPAMTSGEDADETGVVVAGKDARGHFYVLSDCSLRASPDGWARRVVAAYEGWKADRVVLEVNAGGEMASATLRNVNPNLPLTTIHASRGKRVRAEPIAGLYEQGRVHHVGGFAELEDQMCVFVADAPPGSHDDRVDALVYALSELSGPTAGWGLYEWTRQQAEAQKGGGA